MAATPVIANPRNYSGLVFLAGPIGEVGTKDYFLRVLSTRHRHRVQMRWISGEGDSAPKIAVSSWLNVDWMVRGHMIAGQEIGLASMVDAAKNPTVGPTGTMVKFVYASSNSVTGRFVIGGMDVEYIRKSRVVGVSMLLRNTNSADGTANYVEDLTP